MGSSASALVVVNTLKRQPVFCQLNVSSSADIATIEEHCSRPPWSEELIAKEFSSSVSKIYGARLAGSLVAFLIIHVVVDEAHIINLGVDVNLRGQGIGRFLLTACLKELQSLGVRWLTLEVRRANIVARNLYESLGFLEVGLREKYYTDNNEDALILKLNLLQYFQNIAQIR